MGERSSEEFARAVIAWAEKIKRDAFLTDILEYVRPVTVMNANELQTMAYKFLDTLTPPSA